MIVLLMPLCWVESSRCAVTSDGWLNQKEEDATRTLQQATEVQQLSENEGLRGCVRSGCSESSSQQ